jgi:hypothetical protein
MFPVAIPGVLGGIHGGPTASFRIQNRSRDLHTHASAALEIDVRPWQTV